MKTFLTIILVVAFAIAIAGTAFVIMGRERTWERLAGNPDLGPFDMATPVRSSRPHDALLCTPGACGGDARIDISLPAYDLTPAELINRIEDAFSRSGIRQARVDDGADPARLRIVTWTGTMRFPDTNEFLAVPLEGGRTGLVAYARAQLGYSDAGNNLRRLRLMTAGLGDN